MNPNRAEDVATSQYQRFDEIESAPGSSGRPLEPEQPAANPVGQSTFYCMDKRLGNEFCGQADTNCRATK
jgi:hypothetical protein